MRVIIAGSRGINNYDVVLAAIEESGFDVTTVVSGGARGVDTLGERYAESKNIQVDTFLPQWDLYGKSAGYIRNSTMAENAECLVAIWDGKSRGTKNMIETATRKNLKVYVKRID